MPSAILLANPINISPIPIVLMANIATQIMNNSK